APARAAGSHYLRAPATPDLYTLSLHDALPIFAARGAERAIEVGRPQGPGRGRTWTRPESSRLGARSVRSRSGDLRARVAGARGRDRKSTRLNSSHVKISYAVFCLKKKKCKLCH